MPRRMSLDRQCQCLELSDKHDSKGSLDLHGEAEVDVTGGG